MELLECEHSSLHPGDALFLPRRVVHSARALSDSFCAHLTFGLEDHHHGTCKSFPISNTRERDLHCTYLQGCDQGYDDECDSCDEGCDYWGDWSCDSAATLAKKGVTNHATSGLVTRLNTKIVFALLALYIGVCTCARVVAA